MYSMNDKKETNKSSDSSLISLKELCEDLSVSVATGRNWVKLGKITPKKYEGKTPLFTPEYAKRLKADIKDGKVSALKSRRNKKYVSGNNLYNSYVSSNCRGKAQVARLLGIISSEKIELTADVIELLVADCAVKLFLDIYDNTEKLNKTDKVANADKAFKDSSAASAFEGFLLGDISFGKADELIYDLISDRKKALSFYRKHKELFELQYHYEKNEDVLGLIYISCSNMGKRKQRGAYYTPNHIVKKLVDRVFESSNEGSLEKEKVRILDPCCGTGNFLLQLPDNISFESIYGNDIEPASVKIARLNLSLKYGVRDAVILKKHITCGNFLLGDEKYDCIIGNPPWGYEFSFEEKKVLKEKFLSAKGTNIESYDVFIECGLKSLKRDGTLSFVLPEAILNVKAHSAIRQYILENTSMTYLEYLGDAFDGVHCPSIIMSLKNTGKALSTRGLIVKDKNHEYVINTERKVTGEIFSFLADDREYAILNKIFEEGNNSFLRGNAEFALGIVTGNNAKYLSKEKREDNEAVLKGSDICRFYIEEPDNYIVFKPESFQQVAPTAAYRAKEKLFYKFISSSLVFAYDDRQTLSLNSCNIMIPHLDGMPIKYILAVLNSSVAEFIYEKLFASVKVLRSHIEGIPIPLADSAMIERVVDLTDRIIAARKSEKAGKLYKELDHLIFEIYGLKPDEKKVVSDSLDHSRY